MSTGRCSKPTSFSGANTGICCSTGSSFRSRGVLVDLQAFHPLPYSEDEPFDPVHRTVTIRVIRNGPRGSWSRSCEGESAWNEQCHYNTCDSLACVLDSSPHVHPLSNPPERGDLRMPEGLTSLHVLGRPMVLSQWIEGRPVQPIRWTFFSSLIGRS